MNGVVTCPGRQRQPKSSRRNEPRVSAWSRWAIGRGNGSRDHHQSAVKFCDSVLWWKRSQKRSAGRGTQMLTAGICDCQLAYLFDVAKYGYGQHCAALDGQNSGTRVSLVRANAWQNPVVRFSVHIGNIAQHDMLQISCYLKLLRYEGAPLIMLQSGTLTSSSNNRRHYPFKALKQWLSQYL